MIFAVREAALDDWQGIHQLNAELGYDYPPDKTRRRLECILPNETAIIYVAEMNGQLAGYIHAVEYECTYLDSMKDILALVVAKQYRGQGIGRALLTAAEDWAKCTGAAGIRLVSGMDRTGAHKFYEACGYVCRKAQKNFVKRFPVVTPQ